MTAGRSWGAVRDATAAVLVGSRRKGSAVLVDPRHLLTAGHVVRGAEPVRVRFVSGPSAGEDLPATRLALDTTLSLDLAVLDLGEIAPGRLPEAVNVWPASLLPEKVSVLGFPAAEGRDPAGVWRQFAVAGSVGGGLVQLDWSGDAGTLPGHSGGPVVSADTDSAMDGGLTALVGILLEGAQEGRFDRFLPVPLIAQCWPGLRVPWLIGARMPGRISREGRPVSAGDSEAGTSSGAAPLPSRR